MSNYLDINTIIIMQEALIEEFGGIKGIINKSLLESAINRLHTGYYNNLVEEAAALMESLAINHPFADGNKRISFFATDVFLRLNGYYLEVDAEETNQFFIEKLSKSKFKFEILADWINGKIKKL